MSERVGRAFEVFAREHTRSLFGTAYLLCGDVDSAEELVQDALAAALARWGQVEQAVSPVAYVRRSLVNRYLDARRGPRGRVAAVAEIPEVTPEPDIADAAVARESVRALLATLPARPRTVVVLKYLHDWPDANIAEAIGCRTATVRSINRRTLASLRSAALRDDDPVSLRTATATATTPIVPPEARP